MSRWTFRLQVGSSLHPQQLTSANLTIRWQSFTRRQPASPQAGLRTSRQHFYEFMMGAILSDGSQGFSELFHASWGQLSVSTRDDLYWSLTGYCHSFCICSIYQFEFIVIMVSWLPVAWLLWTPSDDGCVNTGWWGRTWVRTQRPTMLTESWTSAMLVVSLNSDH